MAGTGQWRGTRARAGRRDARRMGAAGRGAREEAALAYILVIVASSRSSDTATQQNSLRCSAGHRTTPGSSARQRQQRLGPHPRSWTHTQNATAGVKTVCCSRTNCLMLAHTMDRCALAVEHPFDCGTMRVHWKLQSVRRTPTTSTATQECPAVSGTKSKRASWSCCVLRHQA